MNNFTTGLYFVQKILARKKNEQGSYLYKIKWMGYPFSQSTWQPKANLIHAQGLVEQFDAEMDIKKQKSKQIRRAKYLQRKLKQIQLNKVGDQLDNKINNSEIDDKSIKFQEPLPNIQENAERDINKKISSQKIRVIKKKLGRPFKKTTIVNSIENDVNKYSSSLKANTDITDGVSSIKKRRKKKEAKQAQSINNPNIIKQKENQEKQMQGIINQLLDEFDANKMKPLLEIQQPKQTKSDLIIEEKKQGILQNKQIKNTKRPRIRRERKLPNKLPKEKRKRGRKSKHFLKYLNDENMLKIQKFKVKVSKIDTRTIDCNIYSFSFCQPRNQINENDKILKFLYNDDYNQSSEQLIPIQGHQYSSDPHQLNFHHSQPQQNNKQISEQQKQSYFMKLLEEQSRSFFQQDQGYKHVEQKQQKRIEQNEGFIKQQDSQYQEQEKEKEQQIVTQKRYNSINNAHSFLRLKTTNSYKQQEDAQQQEEMLKQAGIVAQYIQKRSEMLLSNQKKSTIQQQKTYHNLNNTQQKQQKDFFDNKQDGQVENDLSNNEHQNVIKPLIKIKSLRKKRSFSQIFLKNTFQGPKTNIVSGPRQKEKNYKKFVNFKTFQVDLQPPQTQQPKQILPAVQHQKLAPIELQHQLKHFDQRRQYYMKLDTQNKLLIQMNNQNDQKCEIQTKEILNNCPKWLKMFYQSFI